MSVQRRIVCDACEQTVCRTLSVPEAESAPAPVVRWLCVTRPDFDLCAACFWRPAAGPALLREGHGFLCLRGELARRRFAEALAKHSIPPRRRDDGSTLDDDVGALCDSCDAVIAGLRARCTVCLEFDLCEACFALELCTMRHAPNHPFVLLWDGSPSMMQAAVSAVQAVIAQPDAPPPIMRAHVGFGELGETLWGHLVALERTCFGDAAWSLQALRRHVNPRNNYFIDHIALDAQLPCIAYVAYKFVRVCAGATLEGDSDDSDSDDPEPHGENAPANLHLAERPPEYCQLNSLAVEPEFAGLGLGTRLVQHVLHQSSMRPACLHVRLHVDTTNSRAISLYRRHGFEALRVVQNYYGAGKDAFEMEAPPRAMLI